MTELRSVPFTEITRGQARVTVTALFTLISFLLPVISSPVAKQKQIAIIVNPKNPIENLSSNDLEKLLRLDRQRWQNRQRIYLLMQVEGSPEKKIILEKVYSMTSDELKRFWLTKIYQGGMASFPKTLSSNESVRRFVSRVPNAIGFVDASFANEGVKVVKIDGKLPGAAGYLLVGEPR